MDFDETFSCSTNPRDYENGSYTYSFTNDAYLVTDDQNLDAHVIHFLQTIYESQRLLVPVIDSYDDILLKIEGDSMMVLFRSPGKAGECAIKMQHTLEDYYITKPAEEKILLCVGIGYGTMLHIGDTDVFGAQVNASAKLGEDTAKAHEILVTDAVKDAIGDHGGINFEPIDFVPPGANAAYMVKYR